MKTSILDFLRTKAKEKLGRQLKDDEEKKLYTIASMQEKDLRKNLIGEIDEFVSLNCKCRKCNKRSIETDGICHMCKICKDNEIADVDEFDRFYNDCKTGNDNARIIYYKTKVESDGGI